jgi:Tfp pilus assembly protein PilN
LINLNLIRDRERAYYLGEQAGRIAFFVALGLFVLMVGSIIVQQSNLARVRGATRGTQGEIASLQAQKTQIDSLQREIDGKRPLVGLLRGARDSEAKWCNALTHIYDALPPASALIAVRSSDTLQPKVQDESVKTNKPVQYEGFTITGEAASSSVVGQFITNLQNTPSFGDVYLETIRQRKGVNNTQIYEFDVEALLEEEAPTP